MIPAIIHRPKDRSGTIPASGQIWATCLREILFLEDQLSQDLFRSVKRESLELYQEEDSLFFLLGILCGLKSPVLGETEVLGQFKEYTSRLSDDHPLRRDPSLLPFLLNAVKEARTKFLSATGSLTYGQIVRRWLKAADDVTLWGYGSLGREIFPWIREKTTTVMVRSLRSDSPDVPFAVEPPQSASAHVIAAPLSDEQVLELARSTFVVDLRDRALSGRPGVKNLGDLFREIRDLRREREEIVPRCEEFLRRKSREFADRRQIRPFGWEDLCG